jgi:hypothetical protein
MAEQATCGRGLEQNSVLPSKLGELTACMAETLELHMKTLDLTDENAVKEYDVYTELARMHRTISAQLRATGEQMAGSRDLPMGKHNQQAMASPEIVESFENFVKVEEELEALLGKKLEQDRKILSQMNEARGIGEPD